MIFKINFNLFNGDFIFFIFDFYWIISVLLLFLLGMFLYRIVLNNLCILFIDLSVPLIIYSFIFLPTILNIYVLYVYLLLLSLLLCVMFSKFYFLSTNNNLFEYVILLLLSAYGSYLIINNHNNLFVLFLALELQNLCYYTFSALNRFNNLSTEAGLKYFIFGAFSSSLFLFGISLLYSLYGTLEIDKLILIMSFFENEFLVYRLAFIFIFISLCIKIGIVPFHWWLPDVYEGSPIIVTMLFSIIPKIIMSFLIIYLNYIFFLFDIDYAYIFLFLGLISFFFGSINTLFQFNLKRFLAYSSISNIGLFFLILSNGDLFSICVGVYFISCYIVSIFLIFIILISCVNNQNYKNLFTLFDLSLIKNSNNFLSIIFVFLLCSFAGIPPFIGFFGKFFIFLLFVYNHNYILLSFVLIISLISSFYYLRIIRYLFFSHINKISNLVFSDYFINIFVILLYINVLFIFFFDYVFEFIFNCIFLLLI